MSSAPFLSIVVPAFNEDTRIAHTISEVIGFIDRQGLEAELIIVDDGSTDRTAEIAEHASQSDGRVRLLRISHAGKGAAVRHGMLASKASWRFLADADLSMPISEVEHFLAAAGDGAEILVGSREAAGATRIAEPWSRHTIGRVFNWIVKALVLRGINDTQCGFKMFSARTAEALFSLQQLEGFGFDVEILFLAQRAKFQVQEIPVTWNYRLGSKVSVWSGARAFVDLLAIRWNAMRGVYSSLAVNMLPSRHAGTATTNLNDHA